MTAHISHPTTTSVNLEIFSSVTFQQNSKTSTTQIMNNLIKRNRVLFVGCFCQHEIMQRT